MKVKCITDRIIRMTKGKEYDVVDKVLSRYNVYLYCIKTDEGYLEWVHESHLTEILDTPQIEVGSEWCDESDGNNQNFTVLYVGKQRAFIAMDGIEECSVPLSAFGDEYKPKPKTVTMYFYKDKLGLHARELDFGDSLFTKEIEI